MTRINKNLILAITGTIGLFFFQGCKEILHEENKSQLAAENLLSTKIGVETVIADAYSSINTSVTVRDQIKREEMTTDMMWQTGGGENGTASSLIGFFWDTNNWLEAFDWGVYWNAIRDANTVLDNLEGLSGVSEKERLALNAEVRFIRAWAYYSLWDQYGSVPIRTSLMDPRGLPRPSEAEFHAFMESELLGVIPHLPDPGSEPNYGRVHSDGARALLCIWYLNNKKWKECADISQEIIDRGYFKLFPSIYELFALKNERNSEFILVKTALANQDNSNTMVATSLPTGYYKGLDGGLDGIVNDQWSNFASQYRLYDEFYHSFPPGDARKNRILTRYINERGEEINLLDTKDNTRGMKFPPDPATQGANHGNDYPFIRYAEIILARAEALNELNGPNLESINLVNLIRNRAELGDIALSEYPSKVQLRDHILDERRWEFWYEGKRRRDLLRAGKYIEAAKNRGKNATDKHKLFPIPQAEIDANTVMEQNPGY